MNARRGSISTGSNAIVIISVMVAKRNLVNNAWISKPGGIYFVRICKSGWLNLSRVLMQLNTFLQGAQGKMESIMPGF